MNSTVIELIHRSNNDLIVFNKRSTQILCQREDYVIHKKKSITESKTSEKKTHKVYRDDTWPVKERYPRLNSTSFKTKDTSKSFKRNFSHFSRHHTISRKTKETIRYLRTTVVIQIAPHVERQTLSDIKEHDSPITRDVSIGFKRFSSSITL